MGHVHLVEPVRDHPPEALCAFPPPAVLCMAGGGTTPVARQSRFHGVRWHGLLRGHRMGSAAPVSWGWAARSAVGHESLKSPD